MNEMPAGSGSCTVTFVAGSGPLSVRVMVYLMVSPTLGAGLLTVLVSARSACCGVSVALGLLLPGSGSNWSVWLMAAAFVWAVGLATVPRRRRVCGVVVVTVPTVQTPVELL